MAISWDGFAWTVLTPYAVGDRVVNVGNVYKCSIAGTSAASGSGPTGTTTTPITDGSVTWLYLGANVGAVVNVCNIAALPVVTAMSKVVFLALAEKLVADPCVWIDGLLDYGRLYLAGHFGQLWQMGNNGPITGDTVGPLSQSYASLIGPFAVDLTPAGRQYMDLVRTTPATFGLVV